MVSLGFRIRALLPVTILILPMLSLLWLRRGESQGSELQKMVLAEINNRCADCHKAFVDEWAGSRHAKAFAGMNYKRAAQTIGARAEQCDTCHAPGLIQISGLGKAPGFRQAANVPDRGVMCVCCHADANGALHGPHGGKTDFHQTVKDDNYKTNAICVSCHGQTIGAGADYDQVTPFKQYEANAKGATCAMCHMPSVERAASSEAGAPKRMCGTHTWPGAYGKDTLASAAFIAAKVEGTEVSVTIENGTGHMMPGGAWRQAIVLVLANNQVIKREVFARVPGGTSDTRLKPSEKRVITATTAAGAKIKAQLWWKQMPDTPDNQATLLSEVTPG